MPVVQKFKRLVDKKRCGVPFFFSLPVASLPSTRALGWGVAKSIPQPSTLPTSARLARHYLGGRAPLLPAENRSQRAQCADSPVQWAEPNRGPAPFFQSPQLSLFGQKLGPRGGSSCRLQTKAEAPPG